MADEIMSEVDATKISTTYETSEKFLKVIQTPDKIVPVEKVYNIEEIQAQIDKDTAARDAWQAKIDANQAILDKYNEQKNGKDIGND